MSLAGISAQQSAHGTVRAVPTMQRRLSSPPIDWCGLPARVSTSDALLAFVFLAFAC